ncbi:glutaredoxin family protein [Cinnamomum micranthum f. kanehirae]|uniref:Glutaredoxin family protein n=1 Tax=Cinnamomum micranthum f. kanehirae TaxID=337451 RepID=A0A443NB87_9MAGN|nr:glutaredoxin family protein [Cinnamomum micranthum f. kanehirae]
MGCTISRSHPHQNPLDSTIPRALSLPNPLIHHPSLYKGDSHHLVSLTSTTYGSLHLDPSPPSNSTSPDHPTTIINAWELMDGLDDPKTPHKLQDLMMITATKMMKKKPLWKHLSEETLLSEMDPIVISALQSPSKDPQPLIKEPHHSISENRVVVYFTSLRGIRRTYEDCCAVRAIFRSMRVAVDERDVSMDSAYRKELEKLVGFVSLPQVFVKAKYVGGVEEVRQMHESGELGEMVRGVPVWEVGFMCEGCGDARFVPCGWCNGSRKVFVEEEGQLKRCGKCNENGLVRCLQCCC